MLKIIRTDSENPDFRQLVILLDKELSIRDGDEHAFYAQFNKIDMLNHCVVASQDGQAVGCGAFKKFDDETIEIKRMYVRTDSREERIGGKVLKELENWAVEIGFNFAVLETGKKQPEAIHLYKKSGFEVIPNFGQYAGVENSVCLKKKLN